MRSDAQAASEQEQGEDRVTQFDPMVPHERQKGNSINSQSFASSKVSSKLDQSDIFKVKDEYLFVFGGQKDSSNQILNTVEVFDITSEIWREFTPNTERQTFERMKGNELCASTSCFQAVQFTHHKYSLFNDKIYLLGGQDQSGEPTSMVQEFNIHSMQTF